MREEGDEELPAKYRPASFVLQFQEPISACTSTPQHWGAGTTTHTLAREGVDQDASGATRTKTDARENDDSDPHMARFVFGASNGTSTFTKTRESSDTDISSMTERVFRPARSG